MVLIFSQNLLGSKNVVIALCLFLNPSFFPYPVLYFWPASASLAVAALHHGQVPVLAPEAAKPTTHSPFSLAKTSMGDDIWGNKTK